MAEEKNPLEVDEEKRKKTMFIVLSAVVLAIVLAAYGIYSSRKAHMRHTVKKPPIVKTKPVDVYKESWMAKSGAKVKELEEQLKKLQKQIQEEKERKQVSQVKEKPGKETQDRQEELPGKLPKESQPPKMSYPPPPPPPPPQGYSKRQQKEMGPKPITDVIAVVGKEEVATTEEKGEKEEQQEAYTEIPAGSFVKAILLSGLDAPTGGKAKSMPYPVLLRVIDKSILPNKWQADIKDCFMIGEGVGELSSERVFIRVHTLSCVAENGKTYQKKIKAYVSGEDGKVGLQGRVVSKQGALLARTLVAGFLQGVSEAFSQQNTVISVSPLGQTQSIDTSKATQIAAVQGLSEATKKLADFYMKLVDQTFPVIEVNAGRKVDVVFLTEVKFGEEK